MLRFFKFIGFCIVGFFCLICLPINPIGSLVCGAIAFVGYLIVSKPHKKEEPRIATERQKQVILLAQKKEEEAAERRKQAIIIARQRKDLYDYDPSIKKLDKRSTKNMCEHPEKWAEAIEARYEVAKKHVRDAELVINDDIEQLNRYRQQLQADLIPKYEDAIRPFIEDLQLRDDDISTPRELKVAIDFVYPSNLQPSAISQDIINLSQTSSDRLAQVLTGKDIRKLQQTDIVSIVFILVATFITAHYTMSEQRTKLEKVQGDVDKLCEQISGVIRTYGRASDEIKHLKSVHEIAVNYMTRYLNIAIELSKQGKTFSELQETERKAIETLYRGGQSLMQIMKQEVIKPIEN